VTPLAVFEAFPRRLPNAGIAPVALACLLVAAACQEPGGEDLAAEVNGERITYADLDRYGWSKLPDAQEPEPAPDPSQEMARRFGLLRELIDQRMLLQRAAAMGLIATDAEVDAAAERHVVEYGTQEALEGFLRSRGLSLDEFRAELRRRLTVERLVQTEISSRVELSASEMREYYDSHESAFSVYEEQMHLAQILVSVTEASPIPNLRNDDAAGRDEALEKIQWIRDELAGGAEFEKLAREYSEDPIYAATGGDMGFIPQSALESTDIRLRRAMVALKPGEYSKVVETDGEFRILHLISIEPAGQRPFEDQEVQRSIEAVLMNRKEQLLRAAFYEVERNRARIRNNLAERVMADYGVAN